MLESWLRTQYKMLGHQSQKPGRQPLPSHLSSSDIDQVSIGHCNFDRGQAVDVSTLLQRSFPNLLSMVSPAPLPTLVQVELTMGHLGCFGEIFEDVVS